MTSPKENNPCIVELDRLYEDSSYSAQTYFEAAKSAELLGRGIVFLPAVAAAIAALLVALGQAKGWGSVGAIAGAVAATAAFLGTDRKSASYKETARRFTQLRHEVRLERSLAANLSETDLENKVRALWEDYSTIVSSSEATPNKSFKRARSRIKEGILTHDSD